MITLQYFYKNISRQRRLINNKFKKYFHCSSCLFGDGDNVREALFVPYQKEGPRKTRKVSIIGATGFVGAAISYNLFLGNYCDEIIMFDLKEKKDKLCGEALDFLHARAMYPTPNLKICMDQQKTANSDLLIISAGKPHTVGSSRLDVAQSNIDIYKQLIPALVKLSPDCVILVASNPVDLMTYAVWKYSCLEKNRVIGTGTQIDSARFRYHIANRFGINCSAVGGWIVGEHGDSSVALWSSVEIAGTKIKEMDPSVAEHDDKNGWKELHKQVVNDGGLVMEMKGYTNWAISLVTENIARAVLTDSQTIHAVSTYAKGLHGICTECFISLPCVIGNRGVIKIVKQIITTDEREQLNKSASILDEYMIKSKF